LQATVEVISPNGHL